MLCLCRLSRRPPTYTINQLFVHDGDPLERPPELDNTRQYCSEPAASFAHRVRPRGGAVVQRRRGPTTPASHTMLFVFNDRARASSTRQAVFVVDASNSRRGPPFRLVRLSLFLCGRRNSRREFLLRKGSGNWLFSTDDDETWSCNAHDEEAMTALDRYSRATGSLAS
jgi:hypothetical protein